MNSKENRAELSRVCGKYLLASRMTSVSEIKSVEDAAKGYKGLMVIERCFRSLKRTQLKMTPMVHWVPRRIETHVKICVLGLLIARIAELACLKPWSHIRRSPEKLQIMITRTGA